MRTTLTVDDDIVAELRRISGSTRRGFKSVVNELLRRGLAASERPLESPGDFVVKAKSCGFLPGIDPLKLNQVSDEFETETFVKKHRTKRSRA